MKQLYKVAIAALLLVVSSTAVVGAKSPVDESNALAVEGRPIEAIICHVNEDGSGEYMMIRSKNALQTHLQEHASDYRFGTKIGACELGGGTPPGSNASGANATTPALSDLNASRANASGSNTNTPS